MPESSLPSVLPRRARPERKPSGSSGSNSNCGAAMLVRFMPPKLATRSRRGPRIPEPVTGAGATAGGAVARVGEPAAIERQAAAADALGEAGLEPFELGDPLVDPLRPGGREPRPVAPLGRLVGRQLGELGADLLQA